MEFNRTEILSYLKLIRTRKYLFIVLSLSIMSLIVWGSYFFPKKYEAKSIMFIERNVIEELVKGIAITPSMQSRIAVLRDTMLARSLVLDVLRKLDLDSRAKDDKHLEKMIIDFQQETNIKVSNGNLITVSFINKNPVLSRDYINALVSEYIEKNIFAKREEAYDATRFLGEQVKFFKGKMDRGEEKVIKFRQEQGIYVAMDERTLINDIKDHGKDIENIRIRKNELVAARESIKKELKNETQFTTMYSIKGNEDTIRGLENRLRYLLIKYTENYPEVVKLRAQIELLRKQENQLTNSDIPKESEINMINPVYQELKQKSIEIDSEINAMNAKEKYLLVLVKKKENNLRNIPENRKMLGDLEKERDSFREIYEKLLVRLGQSQVSKQMEIEDKSTTFRIIEPAVLPKIPVSPNRKQMIVLGILLGFAGGFGIIFAMDQMDDSIKNLDALKTLGLPVLAVIPRMQDFEAPVKTSGKDVLIYSMAGLYVLCIFGMLTMEFLDIAYVDEVINRVFGIQ